MKEKHKSKSDNSTAKVENAMKRKKLKKLNKFKAFRELDGKDSERRKKKKELKRRKEKEQQSVREGGIAEEVQQNGGISAVASTTVDYQPRGEMTRHQLPIDLVEHQLMYNFIMHDTIIVVGETGSGKSTQMPQLLSRVVLRENYKLQRGIAVTQPRRVAAVSLATRVAEEMQCELGTKVGYHVRFENVTKPETVIEYMTDGVVLRKALAEPLLLKYSVVIIDEAHERSLHTDVLMCILKKCQAQRKLMKRPLKLIIMSATLQARKFNDYFGNAPVIIVPGRVFPLDTYYMAPEQVNKTRKTSDYILNTMVTLRQIHTSAEKKKDILIFLTGSEEIELVASHIEDLNKSLPADADRVYPVPLYAALRPEQQQEAFFPTPEGTRKVILATNIAETSLTIPGVRIVIDSGKVKTKSYNPIDRVEVLRVHNISKAQADQRSGRSNREGNGECYRLYTHDEWLLFEEENVPEILRSNLAATFLELMKMGLKNPHKLQLIDTPSAESINAALRELKAMGAIKSMENKQNQYTLTQLGEKLCAFPLPPEHSRILVVAEREGCMVEALRLVAAMQTENIFYSTLPRDTTEEDFRRIRARYSTNEGDHITLLKVITAANQFFQDLNKKTENDQRFKTDKHSQLQRDYHSQADKFCDENLLNKRNLNTASKIEVQIKDILIEKKYSCTSCGADFSKIRKAIACGLFLNSCEYDRQEDRYRLLINPSVTLRIHPSSCLAKSKPSYFVFSQLVRTSDLFAMQVTLIDIEWVRPLIAEYKKGL